MIGLDIEAGQEKPQLRLMRQVGHGRRHNIGLHSGVLWLRARFGGIRQMRVQGDGAFERADEDGKPRRDPLRSRTNWRWISRKHQPCQRFLALEMKRWHLAWAFRLPMSPNCNATVIPTAAIPSYTPATQPPRLQKT
jgi:hypothetical protein